MPRQDDDLHPGVALLQPLEQLLPVHLGHLQVQQPDVECLSPGFLQGLYGVVVCMNVEVVPLKTLGHVGDEVLLVVYEQQSDFIGHFSAPAPLITDRLVNSKRAGNRGRGLRRYSPSRARTLETRVSLVTGFWRMGMPASFRFISR
jgi:hypothetical protein